MYNKVHGHKERHIQDQPHQEVLQVMCGHLIVEVEHIQHQQDLVQDLVQVILDHPPVEVGRTQPHQDLAQVIVVHLLAAVEAIRVDPQAGVRLQVVVKKDENNLKLQWI